MKVKYLGQNTCLRTNGKIYDVIRKYIEQGEQCIVIITDNNDENCFVLSDNFVVLPADPIEEKKKEIQDAQNVVTEAQKALDVLEKELAELKTPKLGDKYQHNNTSKWIVSVVGDKFALICYEAPKDYECDLGRAYEVTANINNIFSQFENNFTKIS